MTALPIYEVAVTGRADGEGVGGRLGCDWVDLGFLGDDRAGDRVASARLGDVDAREVGLGEAEQLQLEQALVQARGQRPAGCGRDRSEEHTSELQSLRHLV